MKARNKDSFGRKSNRVEVRLISVMQLCEEVNKQGQGVFGNKKSHAIQTQTTFELLARAIGTIRMKVGSFLVCEGSEGVGRRELLMDAKGKWGGVETDYYSTFSFHSFLSSQHARVARVVFVPPK